MDDVKENENISSFHENEEYENPVWPCDAQVYSFSDLVKADILKITGETVLRRLYSLGRVMHDTFTNTGIRYWTSSGTSLGCVRHHGIIPWDDDLDLCIFEEDEDKLTEVKRLLNDKGFEIVEAWAGYRAFHKSDSDELPRLHEPFNEIRFPFCDVFIMKREDDKCYIARQCGRNLFPREFYYIKDIENIERRPFGDFFLNCPANVEDYLSRNYGENWRTEGATQFYNHAKGNLRQPCVKRFKLEAGEHFQPARP